MDDKQQGSVVVDEADSLEAQRAKEISALSDAKLVGALLDQLDTALDTYDAHVEANQHIDEEERGQLAEIIYDIRADIDVPESFLREAGIKIRCKAAKIQDEKRLDQGEGVGVNVEVHLPKQKKVIIFNIWGSRLDYESPTQFWGDQGRRSSLVMDRPRTIDFHVYRKSDGGHSFEDNTRLLHDVRCVMFRSGHLGNRMEVMRYDGDLIPREDRPLYITDPRISSRMNGELYLITDELYNRRDEEEDY